MTRSFAFLIAILALPALIGCKSNAPTLAPVSTPTKPAELLRPPTPPTDAAKREDERFHRELEAKRRKTKSADIDKTNAYRNYVP